MTTKKKKQMKKEIEVKIELQKEEFQKFTRAMEVPHLERTFGYFKKDFSNIQEGVFPRIKYSDINGGEAILSVKRKLAENKDYFERQEIDIRIDNVKAIDDLRKMMKLLGFDNEIVFEKKRINMVKEDIVVSFDELPFGYFVEFEAEPPVIEKYIKEFGLADHPRVVQAYLGLWEDYQKKNNLVNLECVFS